MKIAFFKMLAKFNKVVLPSYAQKDLNKLTTFQKAVVGYRYWVTTNSLPE
ncbi:MAG: hypothetical protein OER04_01885 [Cyclobacteriaceae bacterium]|nr:hypothetical protein [Cyclobacteriaceae bacterium]